jgi:hypothetical protein
VIGWKIYREFAFGLNGAMMAPHGQHPGICSTSIAKSGDDFFLVVAEGKPKAQLFAFQVVRAKV